MNKSHPARKKIMLIKLCGALLLALASVAIVAPALNVSAERVKRPDPRTVPSQDQQGVVAQSETVRPVSSVIVNLKKMAAAERQTPMNPSEQTPAQIEIHPPVTVVELSNTDTGAQPAPVLQQPSSEGGGPLVPSPGPAAQFEAQFDDLTNEGFHFIPPDTTGAVGINKIFSTLNSNYRVQDKATGTTLTTVSMTTFWTALNAASPSPSPTPNASPVAGPFDPQIQYDPYHQRWLVAAASNGPASPATADGGASASILVGISLTSDPAGGFKLFRFIVGCAGGAPGCGAGGEWADFPMLGFNKNWVAVGWNQFPTTGSASNIGKVLILDYPTLISGTPTSTIASVTGAVCLHPVATYSNTEEALYVPQHVTSSAATYLLNKITAGPSGPQLVVDSSLKTRPGGGWTQPGGDILPQKCDGTPGTTCPTTLRKIDSGDAQIRSSPVYRNGSIWYAQTIALPAGGLGQANTHTAVQWTRLSSTGAFLDGGRVEDINASTLGGDWFAYGSIAVNSRDDAMLGYSVFGPTRFASAAYSFRTFNDLPGLMREPVVYKAGLDYYSKSFSGTRNRWGDYSQTLVDTAANDLDMWTIQEYAGTRIGALDQTTTISSRWGTWWAKVSDFTGPPASPTPSVSPTPTPTPPPIPANNNLVDAFVLNSCSGSTTGTNVAATKESGEPSHEPGGNPGGASVWYQWTAPASGSVTFTTINSDYDTLLAVYTGNSIGTLGPCDSTPGAVCKNDDITLGSNIQSTVTFNATAGTTYKIAVDGFNDAGDVATGNIVLNWNLSGCAALGSGIQFTTTNWGVNESQFFLTMTVTRGTTSGTSTVNYATSDIAGLQNCTVVNGRASERCDYVTAVGTVAFAAGESSKTFTVSMINDVHVEGPETFTVTLSNPVGGSLGANSTATVTIVDNDTTSSTTNPIDGVEFFIRQMYRDILNRQPDGTGLQNWINTLAPCPNGGFGEPPTSNCDRLHVAAGFFQSDEFLNRGYFAFKFYMVAFNQRPTYAQFIPDMALVGGPKSPAEEEASKVVFADAFVLRPAFTARYPGLHGQALANALVATSGLPAYTVQGGETDGQILRHIAERQSSTDKFLTEGTVSILYFGFQRRDPDQVGYQNNLDTLNANPNNLRHMIFIFIYSTEYRQRFGPP